MAENFENMKIHPAKWRDTEETYALHKTAKISKILQPHQYEIDGNIYGQNDIYHIMADSGYDMSLWPEYIPPVLAINKNPVEQLYQPLFDKMRQDYFEHAFSKHKYLLYDDLEKLPQFDISRLRTITPDADSECFKFAENEMSAIKTAGLDIVMPCLPEYVIKIYTKHLLYIKMLENDYANHKRTIRFADYFGSRRNYICATRFDLTVSYMPDSPCIEWSAENFTSYEDFLTQDICDMQWTNQQTQMWFDILGIYYTGKTVIANMPICFVNAEDETKYAEPDNKNFTIANPDDVSYMQKELKRIANIQLDIVLQGQEASDLLCNYHIECLYPDYMAYIAKINLQLLKTKTDIIQPEEGSRTDIGSITVKTKIPLRPCIRCKERTKS